MILFLYKMVLLRSYVLLRIACNTAKPKNLNSQYVFQSPRNSKYFSRQAGNAKIADESMKENSATDSKDYIENRLSVHKANLNNVEQIDNYTLRENKYEYDNSLEDISIKPLGALDTCTEDISHIGPYHTPFVTFSKYANKSEIIQQLAKLGVKLYKIEEDEKLTDFLLKLDFNKDIKPYIQFLHDCNLPADRFGDFITKYPRIFMEDIENLQKRITYLKYHSFNENKIRMILEKNPLWLSFTTTEIDGKLGYFQNVLKLRKNDVRLVAVKCPRVVTTDLFHLREITFCMQNEMSFNHDEIKSIIVQSPYTWIKSRLAVRSVFDYAHTVMKLSHRMITEHPYILLCRRQRLEQRHKFLVELKKDQFDPTKPLFISPTSLVSGNDVEFCEKVAKTTVSTYNMFLKSC